MRGIRETIFADHRIILQAIPAKLATHPSRLIHYIRRNGVLGAREPPLDALLESEVILLLAGITSAAGSGE